MKSSINSINESVLKDIVELDSKFFPFPWSQEQWENLSDNDRFYSFHHNKTLIGFCLLRVEADVFHLLKVLIEPNFRSKGLALELLKQSYYAIAKEFNEEKNIFLEVQESNRPAIKFYEKLSLKKVGRVNSYYSDGSGALRYYGKPKFT